jgi:hypothetical protein
MSNRSRLLPAALAAVLSLSLIPAPALAAGPAVGAKLQTTQARFGSRGFGRRAPVYRPRYRTPYRRSYRSPFHGFFGGVLKMLGIAYLAHLLFGLGGGGSPFGLFLFGALVLWLVARPRRRRAYW